MDKSAQIYAGTKLVDLVLKIIGALVILGIVVVLFRFLMPKDVQTQEKVALDMFIKEITQLQEGDNFDIPLFGDSGYNLFVYGGDTAEVVCPKKGPYCACIKKSGEDAQCESFDLDNEPNIDISSSGIPYAQQKVTLQYTSGLIGIS